jgi:hypothetical protein
VVQSLSEDDTKRRKEMLLFKIIILSEKEMLLFKIIILSESSLLTTFAGILFGFLLEISTNAPESFDISDKLV